MSIKLKLTAVIGLIGIMTAPQTGYAAPTTLAQEQKVVPADAVASDQVGHSVAISADGARMVVGAVGYVGNLGDGSGYRGAAYVYARSGSTWTLEQKILSSDSVIYDHLGYDVAISSDGTRVAVSASFKDVGGAMKQGVVYVYSRTGTVWSQEQQLTSPLPGYAFFGNSIAMTPDATRLIVGMPGYDLSRGRAFVFSRSGTVWSYESELRSISEDMSGQFGFSVTISGDGTRAFVGQIGCQNCGSDNARGHVSVYVRSGTAWAFESQLKAFDAAPSNYLGWSLATDTTGTRVVAGAMGNSGYQGAAYVFSRTGTTWIEEAKLIASDAAMGAYFGYEVAMSGTGSRIVVGAYNANTNRGAAYDFSRGGTTWTQDQRLVAADAVAGDRFGSSVALTVDGTRAVVGAPGKNAEQGATYIYASSQAPTNSTPAKLPRRGGGKRK